MGAEHILAIKLKFEELGPDTEKDLNKTVEDISEEFSRVAKVGGEAAISTMTDIHKAWVEFDWGHPIQSAKKMLSAFLTTVQQRTGIIGKLLIGLAGLVLAAFTQMLKPQEDLVKMFSMIATNGESMGRRVANSLQEVTDVAFTTGKSMGEVAEIYTTLGQARVPVRDLKNLTQAAILGSHALGANVDQLTEMMSAMKVMGKLSTEKISGPKGVIQSFSYIQDAVGLTEQEMGGLIQTTTELTRYMSALGANEDNILAMAEATAKLTGLFGELGLGAERAGQIMNKLFDPTQLGENAYLIRSMGMSMQEYMNMLAGGDVDQKKLTQGLVNAAKEIQGMQESGVHVMALQQRAQMMGFSNVQEALRLAKDGTKVLADMDDALARGDAGYAERAAEGMSSLSKVIERVKNRFMAFFGKMAAPLIGKLTNVVGELEKKWMENSEAINDFMNSLVNGVVEFIRNFDFGIVVGVFKGLIDGVRILIKHFKVILPLAAAVGAVFLGFKVLGPIAGIFKTISGSIGGLTKGLTGAQKATKGMSKVSGAFKALQGGLQGFMKMAGVSIVMLAIAGSIWILSKALQNFMEVDWAAMGKAGVALVVLVGIMMGLGLIFATPIGAAMVAGLLFFGAALLLLATSIWIISKAIQNLDPGPLLELAEVGAEKGLIKSFFRLGLALTAFSLGMIGVSALKAAKITLVGKGIKELALGIWVLNQVSSSDLTRIIGTLGSLGKGLAELSKGGKFKKNVDRVASSMKPLAEGIETMTKLKSERLKTIGSDLSAMSTGLKDIMNAMRRGQKDFASVGQGFKDLALGIWVLGEASPKMAIIKNNLTKSFAKSIEDIIKAMKKGGKHSAAAGEGFKALTVGLKNLSDTAVSSTVFDTISEGIKSVTIALLNYSKAINEGKKFIKFLEGLNEAEPVKVKVETVGDGEVEYKPKMGEVSGFDAITQKIEFSFNQWGESIVEAINSLNTAQATRSDVRVAALSSIAEHTRKTEKHLR